MGSHPRPGEPPTGLVSWTWVCPVTIRSKPNCACLGEDMPTANDYVVFSPCFILYPISCDFRHGQHARDKGLMSLVLWMRTGVATKTCHQVAASDTTAPRKMTRNPRQLNPQTGCRISLTTAQPGEPNNQTTAHGVAYPATHKGWRLEAFTINNPVIVAVKLPGTSTQH